MQRTRRQVEGARVEQEEASLASGYCGELGEADVIADCECDLAIFGQVDQCQFVSW